MKTKYVKVYMCGISWQHEVQDCPEGCTIYPTIQDLKDHNGCWEECGIVEIKMTLSKWVEAQNLFKDKKEQKKKTEKI